MLANNLSDLSPMVDKLTRHSSLDETVVAAILMLPFRRETISASSYIVREGGTAGARCAVLLSGFAYVSKVASDGARQILAVQMRGDLLNLRDALFDESDCSVQALTQVDVAYVPSQAIADAAAEHPALLQAFWRDTLLDASMSREWMVNLGQRDALQRISHLCCELAVRQEAAGLCLAPNYQLPMTQEQIGDATGLTSIHVNRTLQRLRNSKIIEFNKRLLTIKDWPALKRAGDFNGLYMHRAVQRASITRQPSMVEPPVQWNRKMRA